MQSIKTIIFDLGGVIINLYVERTLAAFSKLSGFSVKSLEELFVSADVFKDYEKGIISDTDFRQVLRDELHLKASDAQIDEAWNSMLGEIPIDRIDFIKVLKKSYKCIVLSNTNSIHERAFHGMLANYFDYRHLNELFHEVYFSHELSQRKPDAAIYEDVLRLANSDAKEALFMDDGTANLDAASTLGIHTLHIPRNRGFMNLLKMKLAQI